MANKREARLLNYVRGWGLVLTPQCAPVSRATATRISPCHHAHYYHRPPPSKSQGVNRIQSNVLIYQAFGTFAPYERGMVLPLARFAALMREAHLDVFEANSDIINGVQWVSSPPWTTGRRPCAAPWTARNRAYRKADDIERVRG